MGCATSLVKYLVFFFNLLFLLAGLAFIVVGVIFKLNIQEFAQQLEKTGIPFNLAPTLLIIVGCVVFVISFFGCCGAIRESTCMLSTYAIILLTLFIIQVAIGVYAFIQYKQIKDSEIKNELFEDLKFTLEQYDKNEEAKKTIDYLQEEFKCCGIFDPKDWSKVSTNTTYPASCCGGVDPCQPSSAYKSGCGDFLFDFLQKVINIIGIIVITIAAVELVGAIIGFCLSSSIRNNQRRGTYA